MKGKIIIGSFIALVITAIVVWAQPNRECPDGKTAITIVNPAGKVIEICVPDHVAEAGNIGGGNDIVIPATCPCFTLETLDANIRTFGDCPLPGPAEPFCDDWDLASDPGVSESHTTVLQCGVPGNGGYLVYGAFGYRTGTAVASCGYQDDQYGIDIELGNLTFDQAEACRAILRNSEMWALNCDGS